MLTWNDALARNAYGSAFCPSLAMVLFACRHVVSNGVIGVAPVDLPDPN